MERTVLIQQIQERLGRLEKEMESTVVGSWRWNEIDVELRHLRAKLQDTMNSVCPIIKDGSNG